ncbi:uncharacterized protein LOC142180758 [Nicotiana tabacum]|uniref:Uncharacterized protein LOC142180758 n=1 Tax=Nicotiana tabacum TaxID=4097 RepID=A0AC58UHF7_TOBAC
MYSVDGFLDMEAESLQKGKRKRDTVSCREYYCYEFQIRDNETNKVVHCGRIFQQFIVDVYIKLETQRLDFFTFNQDLFRIEVLQGILDILRYGEREASKIGKKTFLPVTFIGGPRDMHRRYMDVIALMQCFRKPDLFITMTCNTSWPEIKEHLRSSDEVQNRPDLVSRVFRAKIEELIKDILKSLPHAHFLIILVDEEKLLTPESYDKFVCAELSDAIKDRYLYSLVTQHIMHGPCGSDTNTNINEIKEYQSARWVSPPEAAWRLFSFPISEMTPAVYHLQLHLEGQQFVSVKSSERHDINEYNFVPERITLSPAVREAKDCHFERNITVREEDLLLEAKLNTEQRKTYDKILNMIFSNQSGAFFIDGPGETGKTFLYRALLAVVRSKGFVTLAITTSGVAASILPGGRTAHSRFKFPTEIDEQYSCNISKQISLAALIHYAKLIVWDEVSMAKKKVIEAFDVLLKDLMDTKALFGGKSSCFRW